MEHKSKSFKALNTAVPIKRQIDDNLNKLQLEKRRFLAYQRQQAELKHRVDKFRKQYNDLKFSQFGTKTKNQKAAQNANIIRDVDRSHQHVINSLKILKTDIDVKRKQIDKYKKLNQKLTFEYEDTQKKLDELWQKVEKKEEECERLKKQLVDYRVLNQKNVTEFQKSHFNLTRSQFKLQNSRKKSAIMQTSFWGEELKNSKTLNFDKLSDPLKNSGVQHNQGKKDIMTQSVPLAKYRVAQMIHGNKNKLRISEQYRRFGQGLIQLFQVMKSYKGRDDLDWIARDFVAKQRQIQKLQQYVSTLQGNISIQIKKLQKKKEEDKSLMQVLATKNENQIQKHYEQLNDKLLIEIKDLQQQQKRRNQWFETVGDILAPLMNSGQLFNRSTAETIIGDIQDKIQVKKNNQSKGTVIQFNPKNQSGHQMNSPLPNLDMQQIYQRGNNQLMDYAKMKEFAEDYLKNKNS